MSRIWHPFASWPRGCLTAVVGIFLALGLVYWGYCWGWWGRTNLTLQYLFQCQCPAASEDVRYRPLAVLASACTRPHLRDIAPSGRYTIIEEERPVARLLRHDLLSGHAQDLGLQPADVTRTQHLDDQLLFIRRTDVKAGSRDYILVDMRDNTQLPIPWQYADDYDVTMSPLTHPGAHAIFLPQRPEILILGSEYRQHPDQNIVLFTQSTTRQESIRQQLTAAGIAFTELADPYTTGPVRDDRFLSARYSHDGQLYALPDGIYDAATQEQIMDLAFPRMHPKEVFRPSGWTPDNRRVVYVARDPHLIGDSSNAGYSLHFLPVPQPIFVVEVPEELVPRR